MGSWVEYCQTLKIFSWVRKLYSHTKTTTLQVKVYYWCSTIRHQLSNFTLHNHQATNTTFNSKTVSNTILCSKSIKILCPERIKDLLVAKGLSEWSRNLWAENWTLKEKKKGSLLSTQKSNKTKEEHTMIGKQGNQETGRVMLTIEEIIMIIIEGKIMTIDQTTLVIEVLFNKISHTRTKEITTDTIIRVIPIKATSKIRTQDIREVGTQTNNMTNDQITKCKATNKTNTITGKEETINNKDTINIVGSTTNHDIPTTIKETIDGKKFLR